MENSRDVVAVDLPPDILSLPVEEAWDALNVALNNMFRLAFQQLATTAPDVSLRELAQRAASNKGVRLGNRLVILSFRRVPLKILVSSNCENRDVDLADFTSFPVSLSLSFANS